MSEPQSLREWRGRDKSQIALVFTDIIGSTSTANRIGDEHWINFLTDHFERAQFYKQKHGGFEVKLIGPSYFIAISQPAFQQVTAALGMAQALQELVIRELDNRLDSQKNMKMSASRFETLNPTFYTQLVLALPPCPTMSRLQKDPPWYRLKAGIRSNLERSPCSGQLKKQRFYLFSSAIRCTDSDLSSPGPSSELLGYYQSSVDAD